mgnify:CR=1 FL=1
MTMTIEQKMMTNLIYQYFLPLGLAKIDSKKPRLKQLMNTPELLQASQYKNTKDPSEAFKAVMTAAEFGLISGTVRDLMLRTLRNIRKNKAIEASDIDDDALKTLLVKMKYMVNRPHPLVFKLVGEFVDDKINLEKLAAELYQLAKTRKNDFEGFAGNVMQISRQYVRQLADIRGDDDVEDAEDGEGTDSFADAIDAIVLQDGDAKAKALVKKLQETKSNEEIAEAIIDKRFPDEDNIQSVTLYGIGEIGVLKLVKTLDPELYDVAMAVLTCNALGKELNSIPLLADVLGAKNPIQWMTNTSNKTVAEQTAFDAYNELTEKAALWFVNKMKRLRPAKLFDSRFEIEAMLEQFPDIADPDFLHMAMNVSEYYQDKKDFLYGILKPAFAGFEPFPDNLANGSYAQFLRMAGAEMDGDVIGGVQSEELQQHLGDILDEFKTNRFSLRLADDLKGNIVASVLVGVNKLLQTIYEVGFGSGEFPPVSEIAEAVKAKAADGKSLLKFASEIVTTTDEGNSKMNAFVTALTDALLPELLKVVARGSKAFDHVPFESPIMAYIKGDDLSFPMVSETAIRALVEMFLLQNKVAADLISNNYGNFERSHMSEDFSKRFVRKWYDEDGDYFLELNVDTMSGESMRALTIPEWWKYLSNPRNKNDARLSHFNRGVKYGYFTGDIVTEYIKEGFKGNTPITALVGKLMADISKEDMREIVKNAAKRIVSQAASDMRMLGLANELLGKHGLADAMRKAMEGMGGSWLHDFLRNIPFEYAAAVLGQDIFMDKFRQFVQKTIDDKDTPDPYDVMEPATSAASEFAALLPTISGTIKNVGLTDENIKEILGEMKRVMGEFGDHKDVFMVAEFLNGIVDRVPEAVDDLIEGDEYTKHFTLSRVAAAAQLSLVSEALDQGPIKPYNKLTLDEAMRSLQFNNIDLGNMMDFDDAKGKRFSQVLIEARSPDISRLKLEELKAKEVEVSELDKLKITAEIERFNKHRHIRSHGFDVGILVKRVFDVSIPSQHAAWPEFAETRERRNEPNPYMKTVFHGTGSVAASMILRYGFTVPEFNPDAGMAGRALGDGVYFTDVVDKTSLYIGDSGYAEETTGYLFEMDAQLGRRAETGSQPNERDGVDWDYRSGGFADATNHQDFISPEWAVFDPKAQVRIRKAYEVALIDAGKMKEIMETNGVPFVRGDATLEENYKPMGFKQYLKEETEDGTRVVRWFFADGLVPVGKGAVAPWQKVVLPNATVEGGALGAMVTVRTNDPEVKGSREVSGLAFVHTGDYVTFCKVVGIKR